MIQVEYNLKFSTDIENHEVMNISGPLAEALHEAIEKKMNLMEMEFIGARSLIIVKTQFEGAFPRRVSVGSFVVRPKKKSNGEGVI